MKLILSSCDFRNENSRQCILDNIGLPIENCRVLYFPNEKATYERIHSDFYINRLLEFGFAKENIIVFDYDSSSNFANLKIDAIYISGGNTFKMLQNIKNCSFDKKIVNYVHNGVVYIGGSAGAHIASKNIDHVKNFDTCEADFADYQALGLFDGILVCHCTKEREQLAKEIEKNSIYKLYCLTDNDSLVIDN